MTENKNLEFWESVKCPPKDVLSKIDKSVYGFEATNISPIWRFEELTKKFGMCGVGWYYEIVSLWKEVLSDENILAFCNISLYIKSENEWSKPISGVGSCEILSKQNVYKYENGKRTQQITGSKLVSDDEAYKKALTDAISVACKSLGMGADVYKGLCKHDDKKQNDYLNRDSKYLTTNKKEVNKAFKFGYYECPEGIEIEYWAALLYDIKNAKSIDVLTEIKDSNTEVRNDESFKKALMCRYNYLKENQ